MNEKERERLRGAASQGCHFIRTSSSQECEERESHGLAKHCLIFVGGPVYVCQSSGEKSKYMVWVGMD